MKKLNNNGWGLGTMIFFIVVFLLFILIVAILSHNMGIEKDSTNVIYENNTTALLR